MTTDFSGGKLKGVTKRLLG